MNGFYITVSNGLLSKEHREKIGTAVWEFMWCLDKITKIDDKGLGYVLGGKPINLSDLADQMGTSEDTASRNLHKLQEEKYITITRTMYGLIIKVNKAKKRFYKNAVSEDRRETAKMPDHNRKNVESLRKNAVSNKTVTEDITVDSNNTTEQSSVHEEVVKVIDLFKEVNPSYQRWYANKTQRGAIQRLITIHGPPRLQQVIELLPKTNKMPYIPTITTPLQLEDKWAQLEAGLRKKKIELEAKRPMVIFS